MKTHRNILYSLVILLLIFQIASFVFISIQFSKLDTKIDVQINKAERNITEHFTNLINKFDEENQRNINELSVAITKQTAKQESFEDQISLIKTSQEDFSEIIQKAIKGVVSVMTESSVGSGFIVDQEGYVVTNYHVIQKGEKIRVLTHDKNIVPAKVLGVDRLRDLALLKMDGSFDYLALSDSDKLQVGRKVIAIGNPLGLSFTVTEGIISGLNREGPNGIEEYIQTDVPLNPGNSGGPLLDTKGEVIGITNFKIGGAESLGFALESNSIKNSINSMLNSTIIK